MFWKGHFLLSLVILNLVVLCLHLKPQQHQNQSMQCQQHGDEELYKYVLYYLCSGLEHIIHKCSLMSVFKSAMSMAQSSKAGHDLHPVIDEKKTIVFIVIFHAKTPNTPPVPLSPLWGFTAFACTCLDKTNLFKMLQQIQEDSKGNFSLFSDI